MNLKFRVFLTSVVFTSAIATVGVQSCGKKNPLSSETTGEFDSGLSALGNKAAGADEALLSSLSLITTEVAPASIRPDPDLYARRLLLQYREEGVAVARAIGETQDYRSLLGGASEDFRTAPQETYDATSLLAAQKVTEDVCAALVNPNEWQHPSWSTILPAAATEVDANLLFLAQRFLGLPNSQIPQEVLTSLKEMVELSAEGETVTYEDYVPACTMLSMDAEALLL